MSHYDATTSHQWDVDGTTSIVFRLGWTFQKGYAETVNSFSGDDPGWPDGMDLTSVRVDPNCCGPGLTNRKEWAARFRAELDTNDVLRQELENEALGQYYASQP